MSKFKAISYLLALVALVIPTIGNCASTERISVRAQALAGYIYPHDRNIVLPLVKGPTLGGELGVEWTTNGSKDWHHDYRLPIVGLGLQVLDFGNSAIMGQMITPYTYLRIPIIKTRVFTWNFVVGGGLGFCTKPCDVDGAIATGQSINKIAADYNFLIGSPVNINITAGTDFQWKLNQRWAITTDIRYNHFSNGSLAQPNGGLNLFDAHIGLRYTATQQNACDTLHKNRPNKRWSGEIIASGGAKKLYYKDNRYYGCASLNLSAFYRSCAQHRVGLGLDLFYCDAYQKTLTYNESTDTYSWNNDYTQFRRTALPYDDLRYRFRLGANICNELVIGKFSIGFAVGLYLYNPIKNYEGKDILNKINNKQLPNKGLFYAYDIQHEDGWNYFRISAKYYITKHLIAQLGFKTHLQKVDFIEFGLGYGF